MRCQEENRKKPKKRLGEAFGKKPYIPFGKGEILRIYNLKGPNRINPDLEPSMVAFSNIMHKKWKVTEISNHYRHALYVVEMILHSSSKPTMEVKKTAHG